MYYDYTNSASKILELYIKMVYVKRIDRPKAHVRMRLYFFTPFLQKCVHMLNCCFMFC